MPLRAVIFDMDGLMLDTERIALRALADAAAELGYPWREEIGLAMVGLNARDSDAIVARYLGPNYSPEPLRVAFNKTYMAAIEVGPIVAKTGLVELLDWLEQEEVPKAVATSTRHERACFKLERAGIGRRFPVIIGGDQVSRGKPAPDIYIAAAAGLGIAASNCLALEDSAPGVNAALAAGMQVIMVPDVLAPPPEIVALGHCIVPSLHDVLRLLQDNTLALKLDDIRARVA